MTRRYAWFLLALGACATPDDTTFTRPAVAPEEIAPGVFRVTWSASPDVVRGFTPDGGRIVYQSRDLPGIGDGWFVATVGVMDGAVREEASIYRRALGDTVGTVVIRGDDRLLVTWRAGLEGNETCVGCPGAPPAIGLSVRRLPATDGTPLSALPPRAVALLNTFVAPVGCTHRIRFRPADREVVDRRVNPFGPVAQSNGSAAYYSDGEAVWRFDLADTAAPADSLGPGAFPGLSPDGALLAVAVPQGVDSVSGSCSFGLCCSQETVTYSVTAWDVVLMDLGANTTRVLGAGLEPVFDPLGGRVVVRRSDALYWLDLGTGAASVIPGTDGGYAPAISPDGSLLAFTADRYGNPDVFYTRIR